MSATDLLQLAATAVRHAAALDPSPGVNGDVGLVVTGGSGGEARVVVRIVDGRPTKVILGPDADCTFTLPEPEALAIVRGDTEPSVAFMRGRLKTSGDNGLVLALLDATAHDNLSPWLTSLSERPRVP